MLPPLLRILLDEPGLLTSHAAAYTDLVQEEAGVLRSRLVRRLGLMLGLAGCAFLTLLLLGMALMLYAASGHGHWLFWLVPAIPFVCTLVMAGLIWGMPRVPSFPRTRAQLSEDLHVFGMKEGE